MRMEKNQPRISIIVTAYNDEKYIADCIASVKAQSYTNWELWVMDDASGDGTYETAHSFEESDERIHVIKNSHVGMSLNRYQGFALAKGEWITFIDGDDVIHPDMLLLLREQMISDETDIVGIFASNFQKKEELKTKDRTWKKQIVEDQAWKLYQKMIRCPKEFGLGCTAFWGKAYRKSLFQRENMVSWMETAKDICPNTFFDDLAMIPRLFYEARRASFCKESVYFHRISCGGISEIPTVSTHNYEQLKAMRDKLNFYLKMGEMQLAQKEATPIFFNCLSTWYKGMLTAAATTEFMQYEQDVKKIYREFYFLVKKERIRSLSGIINHAIIGLWRLSPKIWYLVVGKFYFERKYHYQKREKRS